MMVIFLLEISKKSNVIETSLIGQLQMPSVYVKEMKMPNDPSEIPICQAQLGIRIALLGIRTALLGIVDCGPLYY